MMSIFIDKVSIPDDLDERMLQRKENTKLKARKFCERMEQKHDERRKTLIFEEQELVPPRDGDGSWSGPGPSVREGDGGGGGDGSISEVRVSICFHLKSMCVYP